MYLVLPPLIAFYLLKEDVARTLWILRHCHDLVMESCQDWRHHWVLLTTLLAGDFIGWSDTTKLCFCTLFWTRTYSSRYIHWNRRIRTYTFINRRSEILSVCLSVSAIVCLSICLFLSVYMSHGSNGKYEYISFSQHDFLRCNI